MIEKETRKWLKNWKLILAFCLTSLSAVSCGSIEKNFKPTPTVAPTPTTFPAYKFFFPIPLVRNFTNPQTACEQKHFETYDTTITVLGSYLSPEFSRHNQVAEITYRQFPRTTTETTAVIFPAVPDHWFTITVDGLDSVTNFQVTTACDQNRTKAEWFQKVSIDNLYLADIERRKYLPIKKNSPLAETVFKRLSVLSNSNPASPVIVPMEIVP